MFRVAALGAAQELIERCRLGHLGIRLGSSRKALMLKHESCLDKKSLYICGTKLNSSITFSPLRIPTTSTVT